MRTPRTTTITSASVAGDADVRHLYKIVSWQRACTAAGVLSMGLAPNPIAIIALSTGCLTRWTIIAHHVCHGGYDKCDTQGRYNRFTFGVGSTYRRCVDWLDWMLVEAWNVEHNQLHHYSLGEDSDPDLVHACAARRQTHTPAAALGRRGQLLPRNRLRSSSHGPTHLPTLAPGPPTRPPLPHKNSTLAALRCFRSSGTCPTSATCRPSCCR